MSKKVKMKGTKTTLKHTKANRGESVEFDNQNGYDLNVHFDSSPFLSSLGPSDFAVPAGGNRSKTVSGSAVLGKHYPFTPTKKSVRRAKKTARRASDGPPNPPDVVVSG